MAALDDEDARAERIAEAANNAEIDLEFDELDDLDDELAERRAERKQERADREKDGEDLNPNTRAKEDTTPVTEFPDLKRDRRFRLYAEYETEDLRLEFCCKMRFPLKSQWPDGPSKDILDIFVTRYNGQKGAGVGHMLDNKNVHFVNEVGVALGHEDAITAYITHRGTLKVRDGPPPAQTPAGEVYWWGQHPTVRNMTFKTPMVMPAFQRKRIHKISVGWLHVCVVTEGGFVMSWGSNLFGQLGTGDELPRPAPTLITELDEKKITQVVAGSYYTAAVTSKGELWTWGRYQCSNWPKKFVDTWCNGYEKKGEMGIKGQKIKRIACGEAHMAVITKSGKLFTWGYNENAQLGWDIDKASREGQQKPKMVPIPDGEQPADITCGGEHTCLVTQSGKVYSWGNNQFGELGTYLRSIHELPTLVVAVERDRIVKVSAGRHSTLVLSWDGKVYLWGTVRVEASTAHVTGKADAGVNTQASAEARGDDESPLAGNEGMMGGQMQTRVGSSSGLIAIKTKDFAIGEAHGLLIDVMGSVQGFGYNNYGQAVGAATKETYADYPTAVAKLTANGKKECERVGVNGGQSVALVFPKVEK